MRAPVELFAGVALVLAACSSSAARDPLAPSTELSASASTVEPSASVSSSALPAASASASASPAGSSGGQRECFCAKWEQGTEKREICADDLHACMRRRLLDEKVHRADCLPIRKDECTSSGCEGEKCYRLKPGGATPPR